jgi:hypothetical protein
MHRPPTPSWTRTSLCVSAALAVAIGTSAGAALAATTVVDTGVDTYISSEFPDACYGDPTEPYACSAAPGDGIFGVKWDTSAGAGAEHGLLWFDISPALLSQFLATPGATATLQYNVFDTSTSPPGALHRMTVDWLTLGGSSGDAITWNTIGCSSDGGGVDVSGVCTTAEPTSNASAPAGSTGLFQVDVTADVLAWAGGAANYGWGFRPLGGSGAGIDSFENGVTPTLTLTFPEPVTILRYEFNETGNAPGSSGEDRRPVKMRDDAGTPLDSHTANGGGVSGLPGDRAFANTGADDHGSTASAGANGFRADQAANPALEGLSAFTVSGWFRTEDNTSVNGKTPRLVSNHDGQGFNVQFLSGSEGDLKLEVDDDTAEAASTGAPYDAKQTWVFFAVSYDGTASTDNVNFYIGYRDDTEAGGGPGSADVALVNTATLDRGPVDAGAGALAIGNRAAGDRPFDGFLDDIRIDDFAADGASGLATLEAYRQASLVGPLDMSFSYVDSTTVSAQVLNQSSNPVTVHELSGVAWVPGSITFEAISDDTPSAILNIDVTSGGVFLPFAATAVSATSLADNRDFEGIVFTDPTRNSVFVSEEGVPEIREYNRTTGALLQVLPVPSVFTNRRANRGFESLGRRRDGSEMITGVEQALTVDGPAGPSTTVGTVVRLLRYDVVGNVATPAEQYAYVVEPAHSTPVGDGSSLSDVIVLDNGDLLTVERSDAGGEFLVRVFYTSLAGATDVSLGSLGSGLIGETYTPASKTLLYSSDALDKMEGLALGWEYANGDNLVIG